jgi:hypothetical protein
MYDIQGRIIMFENYITDDVISKAVTQIESAVVQILEVNVPTVPFRGTIIGALKKVALKKIGAALQKKYGN